MKHFGWESSNVQPSCCLDVVVYMLNCVFWRHIPLEIEFKVVAQTMHSGVTHERCADFRHGEKKQQRDEFITPPRPTGRRSNKPYKCLSNNNSQHRKRKLPLSLLHIRRSMYSISQIFHINPPTCSQSLFCLTYLQKSIYFNIYHSNSCPDLSDKSVPYCSSVH